VLYGAARHRVAFSVSSASRDDHLTLVGSPTRHADIALARDGAGAPGAPGAIWRVGVATL